MFKVYFNSILLQMNCPLLSQPCRVQAIIQNGRRTPALLRSSSSSGIFGWATSSRHPHKWCFTSSLVFLSSKPPITATTTTANWVAPPTRNINRLMMKVWSKLNGVFWSDKVWGTVAWGLSVDGEEVLVSFFPDSNNNMLSNDIYTVLCLSLLNLPNTCSRSSTRVLETLRLFRRLLDLQNPEDYNQIMDVVLRILLAVVREQEECWVWEVVYMSWVSPSFFVLVYLLFVVTRHLLIDCLVSCIFILPSFFWFGSADICAAFCYLPTSEGYVFIFHFFYSVTFFFSPSLWGRVRRWVQNSKIIWFSEGGFLVRMMMIVLNYYTTCSYLVYMSNLKEFG